MLKKVDPKMNLPKVEEDILQFWDENKIFEKSIENRKEAKSYSFYDGPPFATGTPHYGHIVASTMKDVVPRFWTMKGFKVERKWGWDCHGLPIENIAEKELGITHKKEIERIGVEKFNEVCRFKVLEYVEDWKVVIRRLGRWADMDNSYKTMDPSFMESVWWVFKGLWDKGLVYEGYRSMHICPRCETTLSQSEVSEGYKTVKDLSVVAKFELIDEPGTFVLAWTTTPWTLIGNVALAVGKDIAYVKIRVNTSLSSSGPAMQLESGARGSKIVNLSVDSRFRGNDSEKGGNDSEKGGNDNKESGNDTETINDNCFIVAKELLPKVFKDKEYEIVEEFKGRELIGKSYRPLFDYYSSPLSSSGRQSHDPGIQDSGSFIENRENGWKIYSADFVTTEEGTGIVHIAPAFGEDDMNLGKKEKLPFVQHIGMDGIIKEEAKEFAGMSVKPIDDTQKTDVEIIKYLAKSEHLFSKEKYEHSYPHCWRCDTPLLNYATSSWFINILKIKDEALQLSKTINWSPKHIKEGRFGKWLEGARDWSISRQRFWASCIPIWKCDKCGEMVVAGSIAELEELSGQKVSDLHKHVVDKVKFSCKKCSGEMIRVPDVLDTWFDSGSMPFAQMHYPFENKEKFEKGFPAEFIGEGVDQTRAWFYYLHVIATALKNGPAFKNVVVNGIVLAEDGKKMSKRLQNYPDPALMFDKYGADAMRFYLITSPVMMAENLNFSENEMADYYRGMFRMLWNSYSFFVLYANIDKFKPDYSIDSTQDGVTSSVISTPQLCLRVEKSSDKRSLHFGRDDSREIGRDDSRGIGQDDKEMRPACRQAEKSHHTSTNILDSWILSELNILIKNTNEAMEHYELTKAARLFPLFIDNLSNWYIRRSRKRFWKSENDGDKEQAYQTLHTVLVELSKLMAPFTPFISEEIYKNLTSGESVHLEDYPESNEKLINSKLNEEMNLVRKIVETGLSLRATMGIKVRQPLSKLTYYENEIGSELEQIIAEEVNVKEVVFDPSGKGGPQLDGTISPELQMEGNAREMIRNIQSLRKKSDFKVDDRIEVYFQTVSKELGETMDEMKKIIAKEVLAVEIMNEKMETEGEEEFSIEGEKIWIGISRIKK